MMPRQPKKTLRVLKVCVSFKEKATLLKGFIAFSLVSLSDAAAAPIEASSFPFWKARYKNASINNLILIRTAHAFSHDLLR